MILMTGDVHGDITRFSHKRLRELKKGDTLIVCGDLGLIWDGSDREKRVLKKLKKVLKWPRNLRVRLPKTVL